MLPLVIALAAFAQLMHATCSSLNPVSLPWRNVTLTDRIAINRGIAIQLGGQPVSVHGPFLLHNTRLRNARDCSMGNASAHSGCQGSSGSSFDIQQSAPWANAPEGTWNVSTFGTVQSDETVIQGYDTAQFYELPEIYGFPFEVWSDLQSDNKSGLALGLNSSFITSLLSNFLIPSSAFGLFFGSHSQTKGVDGDLILGGVDRARLAGPWTDFTTQAHLIDARCPLQVLVKDIRLNNERGSFSLFLDSAATVIACIDPLQNQFTFTQTMYDVFAVLTEHPTDLTVEGGTNFAERTYPLSAAPLLGNLTVELSNGYTTQIPGYEFVSQERGTGLQGNYAVINESRLMVAAGTTGTSSLDDVQMPILGGVYLSQNYLMVDHDNGVFRLAPAVLGEMDVQDHGIVQLCGSIEGDGPPSSATEGKGGSGSKSSAHTIVGGVVSGAAVVIAVVLVFWCIKKRRKLGVDAGRPMIETAHETGGDAPELRRGGFAQYITTPRPTESHRDRTEVE